MEKLPVKQMSDEVSKFFRLRSTKRKGTDTAEDVQKSNLNIGFDDGTRCLSDERYCKTKSGFVPCCTTSCLFQEELKGYWCTSGKTQIQCSPQYSAITVKGEKCKNDHPCGKYGNDCYWCNKEAGSWEHCRAPFLKSIATNCKYCRPNHACGTYGKGWCYTDYDNNWSKCCIHDDTFTAINTKTCKPDHPCGYYGKSNLWCRTTDDSWDSCCKQYKQQ
ncbi:hypothetical protein AOLI_G00080570 [Acnodon oligacanthus]